MKAGIKERTNALNVIGSTVKRGWGSGKGDGHIRERRWGDLASLACDNMSGVVVVMNLREKMTEYVRSEIDVFHIH